VQAVHEDRAAIGGKVADTVPGVIVMVPARTVIASAEVSSSGTGIQCDRMSARA
jgi:hypothetical protein